MNHFDNPSSVAPFRAGYMLLVGMATGKDGYNGLKFEYGELPGPGQMPKFSDFQYFDMTNPGSKPTEVVTQNGNLKGCTPYLFALDEQTLQVVYYGRENGVEGIFGHTFIDTGTNLERIATAQLLVGQLPEGRIQPGATTIPGMPGVLIASPASNNAGINLTWCAPPSNPQTETYDLETQLLTPISLAVAGASSFALSLAVVVNNFSGFADTPFLAVLALMSSANFGLVSLGINLSNGTASVSDDTPVWNWAMNQNIFGLFRGADGIAYAQSQIGGELNISPVNFGSYSSGQLWIECADWSVVANSKGVSQMAPVFYTFGTLDANPNIGDSQVVPVYRSLAWNSTNFQTDQVGQVKRTVFSQTTDPNKSQGIVIGIIESGPPVPNENVVNLPVGSLLGTTTFGVTETSATGWTMTSSLGGVFEFKANAGVPKVFSVNSSMKISLGVTGGGSQTTQETELQSFYSQSSTVAGQKEVVVNTQGVALIYFPTYTCYQYDFLDASGNPIAGAAPYFELYPTGWVYRSPGFDYDPNAQSGIIPGELMSYVVDSDELSTLKSDMLNSSSSVELAWGSAGGESTQSSLLESGTKSIGTYLDFEESIGATFGDELSSVSVSAGVQAKFNFNYTWSNSTNDQIQTQLGLLAASASNPGAYSNYTYDVYLLEHDQSHTQDLINLLQSNPTPNNQALLEIIAPGSVPWKMVHVLRAWQQDPSPEGELSDTMAAFLERHPGWKPRRLNTARLKADDTSG